jgi:hypothetical protein
MGEDLIKVNKQNTSRFYPFWGTLFRGVHVTPLPSPVKRNPPVGRFDQDHKYANHSKEYKFIKMQFQ